MSAISAATAVPGAQRAAGGRDLRIDFFRGLALLFIFVDHVPGSWFGHVTLRNFGFADAAELFVLLAGVSAALAYGRAYEGGFWAGTRKVLARVRTLYIWHVVLVLISAALFIDAVWRFGNPLFFEHSNFMPFVNNEWQALAQVLLLTYQPGYINILPLYIVLLAMFPALFLLIRWNRWAGLAISVAIWAAANHWRINLPQFPGGGWFLNPFAWQLLFAAGVAIGLGMSEKRPLVPARRWLTVAAATYLLLSLAQVAPWERLGIEWRLLAPDALGLVNKSYMSPFRLLHILALAYATAVLVPPGAAWLRQGWARAISRAGAKSLDIFCLGTILSFLGFFAFMEIGRGWEMQLAVNLAGIGAMLTAAWVLTRLRRSPKKATAAAASAAASASA